MVRQGFFGENCYIYRDYISCRDRLTIYLLFAAVAVCKCFGGYFQLQFGMSAPEPVRARFWVPSARMVMMRWWLSAPAGEFEKAMWRPSGDQVGKSQRPISWVG